MNVSGRNEPVLAFQRLRERLGSTIKRIQTDDAQGLSVRSRVAEAGEILLALHQFMEQHKDKTFYDAY